MNMEEMVCCDGCHRQILNFTEIQGMKFCKRCTDKMKYDKWKKFIFSSVDELKTMKNHVESSARELEYPEKIITSLTNLFDDYLNRGFIQSIQGSSQQLFIYKDYFEIKTYDFFRQTLIETVFKMFQEEKKTNKNSDVKKFNIGIDTISKLITQGTIRYEYKNFENVALSKKQGQSLNYIIIQKNKNILYSLENVYFFFAHYNLPETKENINKAVSIIEKNIQIS